MIEKQQQETITTFRLKRQREDEVTNEAKTLAHHILLELEPQQRFSP